MVLSWLTPVNNRGTIAFSICRRRHTCGLLAAGRAFRLCVPVAGQRAAVLAVGSCSGSDVDKFDGHIPGKKRRRALRTA